MELGTVRLDGREVPAIVDGDRALPVARLSPGSDVVGLLRTMTAADLARRAAAVEDGWLAAAPTGFGVPYRNARKVIGIGLNFPEHTGDLEARRPEEPTFFLKADHTLTGHGREIPLPRQSKRVTCEAEVGLVIGRECFQVGEAEALDYVWGVVPVLDQTAEDILQRNPRYLMRAKNFPSFFSFGPTVTPLADVLGRHGSLEEVRVATVRNGSVHRENVLAAAYFSPAFLLSFLSHVMPLYPGDIISTGTPGAVPVSPGDIVECHIDGLAPLSNTIGASQ